MAVIDRIRAFFKAIKMAARPSDAAWQGASGGVLLLFSAVVLGFFLFLFARDFSLQKLPAFFIIVGAISLVGLLTLLSLRLIGRLAPSYRLVLFGLAPFIIVVFAPGDAVQKVVFGGALVLIASFIGAGIAVFYRDGLNPKGQKVTLTVTALGFFGLVYGAHAVFGEKDSANPLLDQYVLEDRTLALPNPGQEGHHEVLTLTYGSGKDRHRQSYAGDADLLTEPVDGSKLIDNWDGMSGWLRTRYWGFDATELPLQARVWYPQGDGPFPIVLAVHGNHAMEDFSDPGYAYLGELFASRGIIFASVDENAMNFSMADMVEVFADRPGLIEENDARGWLLLKHLEQWREWDQEPGHLFYDKVDLDRIALIGHSRGGEAVAAAAAFNTLARYPDDASIEFDFNFNLRGVIAVAPVDGQYLARGRGTPIKDVNYFTVHGSMDGDVQSFEGASQYARVSFTDPDVFHFKSSLYVTGANHGQFNTSWNKLDRSQFDAWALNLGGIMPGEDQRDVARVYFGAFMEIVLRDATEYLPVFSDARYASAWLPNTFYINQYSSSSQVSVAHFEEDIDPTTNSLAGGSIHTSHLSKWYEHRNALKWDDLGTHSMIVAWDKNFSKEIARVDFVLPKNWSGANRDSSITASLSTADTGTLPDDWMETQTITTNKEPLDEAPLSDDESPLDWSVVLTDRRGATASVQLSYDSPLYPLIQAKPMRADFLDSNQPTEVLFRRFEWPVSAFTAQNSDFEPENLAKISFVFDRSSAGAIAIDDLSITHSVLQ